jgi:hypothetical protein
MKREEEEVQKKRQKKTSTNARKNEKRMKGWMLVIMSTQCCVEKFRWGAQQLARSIEGGATRSAAMEG